MIDTTFKSQATIDPIRIKPEMRMRSFGQKNIEKIHQATLTVLEQAGVRFPNERALRVFEAAGANVDHKTQIVKIPPDLLIRSIAKAPRSYTMASRGDQSLDLILDGTKTYCGTDGTGTTTVDLFTRETRASCKADVAMMAKICDYLSCISFYWPMVTASDVPDRMIPLHEIHAAITNTEKHVHIISCTKPEQAKFAVEIASAISGDKACLKKRPPVSMLACPISPLAQESEALEAALVFAEAGLPVGFATMPMLGSTAPASVPGLLVTANAELLSAICYVQLVCPGAATYYALFSTILNPYTGGCVSSTIHQHFLQFGATELGHFYDLPVMSSYGSGDSKILDSWLTGKEVAIDTMFSYMHQPDMFPGMGLINNDTLLYPEQILLDNEVYQSIQAMAGGIEVTDEDLALDDILENGIKGHFITSNHTAKNLRKLWKDSITKKWSKEKRDFLVPQAAAIAEAKAIFKNHQPRPLDHLAEKEINKILVAAEKELIT